MITFGEYYRTVFRGDLQLFLMSIPLESRHHDGKNTYTIQYSKLCRDAPHMDTVPCENRSYFAIALFFTVLVDEVCYTYFRYHYEDFRRLTLYPKFIGDCPGGCRYHLDPYLIFEAINRSWFKEVFPERGYISVWEYFDEATDVMKEEIFDFFTKYMTTIQPEVLWARCVDEFPPINKLRLYDKLRIPWINCQAANPMNKMSQFPLIFEAGHLFVEIEDKLWLLDTGSPCSFGEGKMLSIEGKDFTLHSSYLGMTAETLTDFVGVQCSGILGADILGRFDHIIDSEGGSILMSRSYLTYKGALIHLDKVMRGIPILTVRIGNQDYRMFLDTGAQISYFQGDSLSQFPTTGRFKDFYPGLGEFEVDTYKVNLTIGPIELSLITGKLPELLDATLSFANTQGIIGNQVFSNRIIGYSPRRNALYL